jgi:hypothetical protein
MKGRVYFFQCRKSTAMKLGPGNSVFMDKKLICQLQNKRFSLQEIELGEHTFSFQPNGKELEKKFEDQSITINVESGKTYYIELFTISHFITADYFCQEVPENTFIKITKKYIQNKDCK